MIGKAVLTALIATTLVSTAHASDDIYKRNPDANVSKAAHLSNSQLRTMLEEKGYKVLKIERETNEVEVYAKRDGQRWELELDPTTGRIREMEEKY